MNINRTTRFLLAAVLMLAFSAVGSAQVFLSVNFGPPALPVYPQPVCPTEGYIWTPGYWAWGPYGYYWVPGTWVPAPQPGLLWTPGYWAYNGELYYWHPGYWGPVVGFYGGIAYGYGYTGTGYSGGYWRENHFYYNQTVNNVNVTNVHNVYNTTVINNTTNVTQVSYNGGPGGIVAHPTPEQEATAQQKHVEPTPLQIQHENSAKENPQLRAAVNQGRPSIAATPRPAEFSGQGVVAATRAGAPYQAGENRPTSANDVARPDNNARPEEEGSHATPPRNYVPRPPSAADRESRPEAAPSATDEDRAPRSVPRPPSSYPPGSSSRVGTMPDAETSHPENTPRGDNIPRPASAPPAKSAPRPEASQPRQTSTNSENASRPSSEPRPQNTPPKPAPEHAAAPHPQAAPRPDSAPEAHHENPPQR